jgi:putative ABC transport system substrate-binding protein
VKIDHRNRHCLAIIVSVLSFLVAAAANGQAPKNVARVGILFVGGKEQPHLAAFKNGLRERGYTEGKNIVLNYRYGEGDYNRLTALAEELVRDHVDVIVTTSSVSAQAARKATQTIPIVMTSGNPLEQRLAESLAQPGGNVTGLSLFVGDLSGKRVELLKEAFPNLTRVACLWSPREDPSTTAFKETERAAKAISIQLHSIELRNAADIDKGFAALPRSVKAVLVTMNPLVTLHSKLIVELALKHRLPGMYPTRQFAEEGGLLAYGPLIGDLYRRAAIYVDKILKGAKPADLPIEQPTKFEWVANLKTAGQIGVTIPPNVLARADQVIK